MAVKTQYIVAGIEFERLDDATQFDRFLKGLAYALHPYQLADCSYEMEMQISARAVIETLRVAYGNKADLFYAEPEMVWHAALQHGFEVPEPTKVEPTKVEPTKVEPTKVEPKKVAPKKVAPKKKSPNDIAPAGDWS